MWHVAFFVGLSEAHAGRSEDQHQPGERGGKSAVHTALRKHETGVLCRGRSAGGLLEQFPKPLETPSQQSDHGGTGALHRCRGFQERTALEVMKLNGFPLVGEQLSDARWPIVVPVRAGWLSRWAR